MHGCRNTDPMIRGLDCLLGALIPYKSAIKVREWSAARGVVSNGQEINQISPQGQTVYMNGRAREKDIRPIRGERGGGGLIEIPQW